MKVSIQKYSRSPKISGTLRSLLSKINGERKAHLSLALPINKETIFVDLEHAIQLDFSVIFLFRPTIEDAADTKCFRHLDLPIELELLRHLRGVPPISGKVSLDTAFSGSVNKDQCRQ